VVDDGNGVDQVDVVVVGFGPGAQALVALLGRRGHRVIAFERYAGLYNNARAGHMDHEVLRIVQSVAPEGAAALDAAMLPALEEYLWLNGDGEVLFTQPHVRAGSRSVSGWYSDYTMWQPDMEDVLADVVAGLDRVEVAFGWEVTSVAESGDGVRVTANRVEYDAAGRRVMTEEYRTVEAKYAVGADGAGSFVRRTLGIPRNDQGLDEQWLVVDLLTLDHEHRVEPFIAQIADPARPTLVMPLGRRHRRFEWAVLPGESAAAMSDPAVAWRLLERFSVTSETHRIERQVVYRFQAREAASWRVGRIFLMGDAAHTMPPYAGQGLCSAVRDAANLAWKLDLTLNGVGGDPLLDTYELERRPHVRTWTGLSIAEGRISNVLDPEEARLRDERLREHGLAIPDLPILESGALSDTAAAGELGPQAPVRQDDREDLLESLFPGPSFWLLSIGSDPIHDLPDAARALLDRIGTRAVHLHPADSSESPVDLTGAYTRWLQDRDATVVLVRPDFAVFGTASTAAGVADLVAQLETHLASGVLTGTSRS